MSPLVFAGPAAGPAAVVGTISSTAPVTINGSEMSPTVSPSWPLVAKDEIATTAAALLQTSNRDRLILDANTRARIGTAGGALQYIYIRQGGLQFDTQAGPVYICMAGHLYVPAKSSKGILRLQTNNSVGASLDSGAFTQQGTRSCPPDASTDFLAGLPPGAAGGAIGGAGGISTAGKIAVGVSVAAGAGAAAAGFLSSSNSPPPCTSCAIPPAISPSVP